MTDLMTPRAARDEYVASLTEQYTSMFGKSRAAFERGRLLFPNGVSQPARLMRPFPPVCDSAFGAKLHTIDGHDLIDYWQGHLCTVLGHSPKPVVDALRTGLDDGIFVQMGVITELEEEVASLILAGTPFEQILFTPTGAIATMQSTLLALAHTGRTKVLKIEGGWHGAQPWSFKGVRFPGGVDVVQTESSGISASLAGDVLTVPYNDIEALEQCFARHGAEIGACIVEFVIGTCGIVMADPAFIRRIRELTSQTGSVMIADELVTGYRVRPGGMFPLFGIEPDISTFGKALSGGMPFACIAGRRDILSQASITRNPRVWADSGTFTSLPASLIAVRATLRELTASAGEIFPQIIARMNSLRTRLCRVFESRGIAVDITGTSIGDTVPNFPVATVRFLTGGDGYNPRRATSHWDARVTDVELRDHIAKLALLVRGIHSWNGLGAMTYAHTPADIDATVLAYESFADDIKGF